MFVFYYDLQSETKGPYITAVRSTLEAALCSIDCSSQDVERHMNKPEVEVG